MTGKAKQEHELEVFREFMHAALTNEQNSGADSRSPPEPDILFKSTQRPRYFELGRLLDAEASRTTLKALRQAPKPVNPDIRKITLPEREVLRRKLSKAYDSNNLPIELLLYFDRGQIYLEGFMPLFEFSKHAEIVMVPLLQESMGPFSKVWVFERYRHSVLWSYEIPHAQTS